MSREMKDSGIEWIGSVPKSWEILPAGRVFSEVKQKNTSGNITHALQFKAGKIISKPNFNAAAEDYVAETIQNYTIVEPGTIMINGLNLNYDLKSQRIGLVNERGVITSAYLALAPDCDKIIPEFAAYLFKGYEATMAFHNMGVGIRKTLGYKEMKYQPVLLPQVLEQNRIIEYLNYQCSGIEVALERTRASIEEYKKLKQAVITQAVTKGIRGKRSMKDSGVEWIGVLPTDWSVTTLKYCASLQAGITLGKKYPKGTELIEVPYLRVANVQGDHVDISDVATIQVTAEEIEKYALHDGELLMTEGGDRDKLGRGTVWHGEIVPCIHQNHVFAVETDESKLLVHFFDYVTSAAPARTYFDLTAKKTTNLACTNSTTILSYRFALPPIAEQQEIVEYLDSKCVELDALIAKKEQYLVELEN